MRLYLVFVLTLMHCGALWSQNGPYAPNAAENGTSAIHKDSSIFNAWATGCTIDRGWQNIAKQSLGKTTLGNSLSATEKAGVNGVVSLGDGGSATLTFDIPIANGPGPDFAVFENGFNHTFLELAFVEVSSNGEQFFRFDAISLTDTSTQLDNNASMDPTKLYNLAGKYKSKYGTPFDLEELKENDDLNVDSITHVRIIDVIGSLSNNHANKDAEGRKINDPYPTPFASGGFDLDAVGIINTSNTTNVYNKQNPKPLSVYPLPAKNDIKLNLPYSSNVFNYAITNMQGVTLLTGTVDTGSIDVSSLNAGIYFITCYNGNISLVSKLVIEK